MNMQLAALRYAAKGRPVFPCSLDKKPLTGSGFKDATSNPEQVTSWWAEHPEASIGCATGDGIFVVDVDLPDGPATLASLEERHGPLPATLEQRTGGGGRQLFFTIPEGVQIRNSAGKLGTGIDIRGDGGYVILPPSRHPSGGRYEWIRRNSIAAAPGWLIDLLTKRPERPAPAATCGGSQYGQRALASELSELSGAPEGQRNHRLNAAAFALGQLVGGGEIDRGQVEAALLGAAAGIGLSHREAAQTIRSGLDAGLCEPRTAPPSTIAPVTTKPTSAEFGGSKPAEHGAILQRASDIVVKAIQWLWLHWLARGKLHIIAGMAGTGKTSIALALLAILTNGRRWPDGAPATDPANVIIWSSEDGAADTLVPRLISAGADLSRVHIVVGVHTDGDPRAFDPSIDLPQLIPFIREYQPAALLVDPIVSAVIGDSHKNAETRRSLQPLVDLAERYGFAVLGISHFSKGTGGRDPLERVTGSLAFAALARVVLAAAKLPPDNPHGCERILARAKSNIGPDEGGIGYRLTVSEVEPGVEVAGVEWQTVIDGTARDLLAEPEQHEEGGALGEAIDFLEDLLGDGPKPVKVVLAAAKQAGIAERTLKRAKATIGAKAIKSGLRDGWFWSMPTVPTNPEECHHKSLASFEQFEECQQFEVASLGEDGPLPELDWEG